MGRSRLNGRNAAIGGSIAVFCFAGAFMATALGLPVPWSGSGRDYGVPREIPLAEEAPIEVNERAPDTSETTPSYLVADMPVHLIGDEDVPASDEPPPTTTAGSGRVSAGTAVSGPAPTTTVAVTTTTAGPATTTTTAPPTTTSVPPPTTLPESEPDGSPVAVDDGYTIPPGDTERLWVLQNDSDPDDGIAGVSLRLVVGPANARRFSVESDHFRYRSHKPHHEDFSETDSFIYEICDQTGSCDTATVTVTITTG